MREVQTGSIVVATVDLDLAQVPASGRQHELPRGDGNCR